MKISSSSLFKSVLAVCLFTLGLNKAAASIDSFSSIPVANDQSVQVDPCDSCEFGPGGGEGF